MNTYHLYTPFDGDDSTPKTYRSPTPPLVGDTIQLPETGYWHVILAVEPTAGGTVLTLSQSDQTPDGARLVAQQTGRL
jgi:hypothetical protein